MTQEEELVYGLGRWCMKAHKYVGDLDVNQFVEDEKSLDAVSYCIEIVAEIALKLTKIKDICDQHKDINFVELSKIKEKCFVGDNINIGLIYQLAKEDFLKIYVLLNKDKMR
jgi:uncharacterized protein with HEPN domain